MNKGNSTRNFGRVIQNNTSEIPIKRTGGKSPLPKPKKTKSKHCQENAEPQHLAGISKVNRENIGAEPSKLHIVKENVQPPNTSRNGKDNQVANEEIGMDYVDLTKTIESKVRSISFNSTQRAISGTHSTIEQNFGEVCEDINIDDKPEQTPIKEPQNRINIDFANPQTYYEPPKKLPMYVEDFDKTQVKDLASEPHYANDVFTYYKERELALKVTKYLHKQTDITKPMRAVLVDWMVEVQESFELNHETLYLAVKLVDHFLSKKIVTRSKFQLIGATCILIAAKFDERIPPAIEDFLYICDDAYQRKDIILMEMEIFRKLNCFIGFPISYRFLRRYARCGKLSMETLTLARYILEMSLMDYDLIDERDSMIAGAALLLALKMKKLSWNSSLEYYTGYEDTELLSLMYKLNDLISTPKPNLKTIRTKYSHRIFFEVALISPLPKSSL